MRKDGSRFWGDVVITALHDDDGNLTGYAKVTRDRTDLKALEEAQDAFYATFNHDFRTPITAIKGFVDAIRDADDDDRGALIDRVEANADRLLAMVEELVLFASQRAGNASLLLADIDVAQVARDAVRDLAPVLGPDRVHVSADAVALAQANGVAMHRVVTNLVVNALRYSPPGLPRGRDAGSRASGGGSGSRSRDQGRGHPPGRHRLHLRRVHPWTPRRARRRHRARPGQRAGAGRAAGRAASPSTSEVGVGTTVTVELPAHAVLKPSHRVSGRRHARSARRPGLRASTPRRPDVLADRPVPPGSPRPLPPSACAASCAPGR